MEDMEFVHELCDHIKRTLKKVTADVSQMNRPIDPNEAQYVDYLAHAWKSLKCVTEMSDGGGSSSGGASYRGGSYRGGGTYDFEGGSHDDGGASGRRGRMNAPRDSMGRYSGDGTDYSNASEEMIKAIDRLKSLVEHSR